MNKKSIIEKIKKCLALSKSANQHEAAAALRQAYTLMEKYNIDADDAELLGIQEAEIIGSGAQKSPFFELMLAQAIATIMDCKFFHSYGVTQTPSTYKIHGKWVFAGFDPAPEIATYAFDVLYRQLKKARKHFIDNALKRVKISANKTKRADLFCQGWVIEATEHVRNIKPNSAKLAQIKAYIEKKHELKTYKPKNRNEKTSLNSSRNFNDFDAGRRAGKNAQLNQAMNGGNQQNRLGTSSC
ncbi:DUF2786 domain-containing protein [Acinetobacter puyangensis]|uniref:DUF2786 domain-containing protein n=1 Tax=Acinetobacter puyangensis TaxID=1096779 RepID=UPI003A4DEDA6